MTPMVIGGVAIPPASSPVMETASEAYDSSGRGALKVDADAGDSTAQFKLGELFCCQGGGPLDRVSVYDNNLATEWYCRSARQDYLPAQMRLAELYSGHPIHGIRLTQRISALLGNGNTDPGVALMWASVAAESGNKEAIELRERIVAKATPAQRAKTGELLDHWRLAPCLWSEVFPSGIPHQTAREDPVQKSIEPGYSQAK